jgi:hypothetical protein
MASEKYDAVIYDQSTSDSKDVASEREKELTLILSISTSVI